MQGLNALIREWAHDVADSVPISEISDVPDAWHIDWGTAGHHTQGSPFETAMTETPSDFRDPMPQRDTYLQPSTGEFIHTVMKALDSHTVQGFRLFESSHQFAVWKVPIPDFEEDEEANDGSERVAVQTSSIKRGFLPLAVILQFGAVTEYVVSHIYRCTVCLNYMTCTDSSLMPCCVSVTATPSSST